MAVDEDIAISPLAIPLIAGPGTLVTSINYVTDTDYIYIVIVIITAGLIMFLNHLAFFYSGWVVQRVGNNVITVIAKIMGLIIAIIGIKMVLDDITLVTAQ